MAVLRLEATKKNLRNIFCSSLSKQDPPLRASKQFAETIERTLAADPGHFILKLLDTIEQFRLIILSHLLPGQDKNQLTEIFLFKTIDLI